MTGVLPPEALDLPLLAAGRSADVYDLGDGTVLRRRRDGASSEVEAAAMRWAGRHGVPVPAVVSVAGPDLVMEEVTGPTLLAQVAARPGAAADAGAVVAAMHRLLDDVPGHPGLPARHTTGATTDRGASWGLLHGDLHPGNIITAPRGPVLIDFTDAGCGPRAADVAETWVLLACYDPGPGQGWSRARRELLTAALSALDADAASRHLRAVTARRHRDPHTTQAEQRAMTELVTRCAT